MSLRLLRRLAGMSGHELRYRAAAGARIHRDRLRLRVGGSQWDRRAICRVVVPEVLGPDGRAEARRSEWGLVARRLRERLVSRPSRFVIDPQQARALAGAIRARWPHAAAAAAGRADATLHGSFDLLGYQGLSFTGEDGRIDWHLDPVHGRKAPRRFWADVPFLDPANGDHKVIWEINRQQYLLSLGRAWWLTGDRRYHDAIPAAIRAWLSDNPPLLGINWASMLELAFRSLSWVAALHFVLGSPRDASTPDDADDPWLLDLCIGLDRQLTHVEQNLSYYFSPNTHLTGEALALYVTGTALPELAGSRRWTDRGRAVLLTEATRQIAADGGHVERSPYYHRYTLDFYTLALITAEIAGDAAAAATFRDVVRRLATFMASIADDRGLIPLIGDDDGGCLWPFTDRDPRDVRDALSLAGVVLGRRDLMDEALPEETVWLAWSARPAVRAMTGGAPNALGTPVLVRHFAETGYAVVRNAESDHLVFDVGPHGFLNGGHAHADALACTLALGSQQLLIDPGTATYTMDAAIRRRLRESRSHNTLTIDGRSSAVPAGPFNWASQASARLETCVANPLFTMLDGTHEGYAPALHRRTIVHAADGGWLFIDTVTGLPQDTDVEVDAYWHFDPAWHVANDGPGRLGASGPSGARAWLLHDGGSATLARGEEGGLGWCAPRYGRLQPTCTLRVHHKVRAAATLATWVGHTDDPPAIEVRGLRPDGRSPSAVIRVASRRMTAMTMLGPDAGSRPDTDSAWIDAAVATDARLVQVIRRRQGRIDLSLAEATRFASAALPVMDIRSREPMADLHVVMEGGAIQLWSSAPPGQVTLRWAVDTRPGSLRLNGRDARLGDSGRDAVYTADAWGVVPRTEGRTAAIATSAFEPVPAGAGR